MNFGTDDTWKCIREECYIESNIWNGLRQLETDEYSYIENGWYNAEKVQDIACFPKLYETPIPNLRYVKKKPLDLINPFAKERIIWKKDYFVCLIEILGYTNEIPKVRSISKKKIAGKLATGLENAGIATCIGRKDENLLLVYVGLNEMNGEKSVERQKQIADTLGEILEEDCFYVLAAGSLVEDVLHIYQSYNDGVALLMTTFYYEKNCRLVYERLQEGAYKLGEEELQQFTRLVKHEDFESTVDFVTGIVSRLRENPDSFIYEVKDFFARMLDVLFQTPNGLDDLEKNGKTGRISGIRIREMKF